MGQFLQITIARKTRPFLKKNYTISRDHELQKWATFCKLRSQEKLYHFSRKTIQFLLIANCRIGPLSANYDGKRNYKISQEKLYKILVIANCRNGLIFASRDAAVVVFFFDHDHLIVDHEMQGPSLDLYNFGMRKDIKTW